MFELTGKYASAKVFADDLEQTAIEQIQTLIDQPFMEGSNPRFMPDAHAGKGCVIGTTMIITDEICPNLVGVDIACGVLVVSLGKVRLEPEKLDRIIHRYIPAGFHTHRDERSPMEIRQRFGFTIEDLKLFDKLCPKIRERARKSYGTLGGGNHFIELAQSEATGHYFLVIHSGSRHLGHQIAEHYQKVAERKRGNRQETKDRPRDLATLHRVYDETDFYDYLHDCEIARLYAKVNRLLMAEIILTQYFEEDYEFFLDGKILKSGQPTGYSWFESVHNYIDQRNKQQIILRKGAISARTGEKVIIPLNMRDGSLLALGKGNPDWNYSGPHGAGRTMSRTQARKEIKLKDFQDSMAGIYTTTATQATLDEAPSAYKDAESIIKKIDDALTITDRIRPIYNFKAK